MSVAVLIAIWLLSAGLVVQTFHIHWCYKEHLKLRERVHQLEMQRDYPNYKWKIGDQ